MSQILPPEDDRPYALVEAIDSQALESIDLDAVSAACRDHGAVLIRGFTGDLGQFQQLARRLCPLAVLNDSGNRASLDVTQNIQSVNLGTRAFPLHPELSREPWKPDSCFFYCLTPPSQGGATTICDGAAIVRALPTDLRDSMAAARLKYVQAAGPAVLQYWLGTPNPSPEQLANPPAQCAYSFERIGHQVVRVFTRPLLHRTAFGGDLAFGNFLLFARYLRGTRTFPLLEDGSIVPDAWVEAVKAVSDKLTVPIEWRAGDLLILDNSRFMHGRTAIQPGDNRLIATYFGYWPEAPANSEEPPNPPWRQGDFRPPMGVGAANPAA